MSVRKILSMDKNIDFNDVFLKAKKYSDKILKAVFKVIESKNYLSGKENRILENNLKKYLKGGNVVTVASGHDAILLALQSLDLKPEDEVIFPVNSYPTAFPVALTKAKLIPCDVDRNGLINVNEIAKKINKNTKVIILVHLYGFVVNIDEINKLVKGKNIILIEDCAQAFGAKYNNKPVGSLCDIGCFSFYPTKNLGTLGDGGAIWTKNNSYYQYFLEAKAYGEKNRYNSLFTSGHSRLPEIQASILNIYFKNIKKELNDRIKLAEYFNKRINEEKLANYVRPLNNNCHQSLLHLFVVEAKKRNELQRYLKGKGIPTLIHYPYPIHLVPAFSYLGYKSGDFPIAERLLKNILSLPFHPMMTKKQINYIIKLIKRFYV